MNSHRPVAQHGFRTGGGNGDVVPGLAQGHISLSVLLHIFIGLPSGQRVFEVPHVAGNLGVLDLKVGNRGLEMRVPVHEALAAIDQALVVKVDKDLDHRIVEVALLTRWRVGGARHGKGLTVPVAGRAKSLQLPDDRAARLLLLFPDPCKELLTPHGAAVWFLVQRHLAFRHHLGRDPGVVGAGLPERIVAHHPVPAGQDVLQRVVERVAHVERAGHVRRRDHDGKGGLAWFGIRSGGKGLGVKPKL